MPAGLNINLARWLYQALLYTLSSFSVLKRRSVRDEFVNQFEYAGLHSLELVGAIGVILGTIVIDQSVRMVGAAAEVPVRLLGWTLFGEAGPLAVGFLVAARVAPTMGADLALMRFRGELKHLQAIDIPAADFLVVPRVIAASAAGALLSVYFMASALFGGMLVASILGDFSFTHQLARFFEIVNPISMLIAVLKCCLFGGVVALVSCYEGLMVERDAISLSEAGSRALTRSLLVLAVFDAIIMLAASVLMK